MSDLDLSGKVSVITGATKGIGKGIAETFARHGSKVALTGRNKERGKKVSSQIKAIYNTECIFYDCDVGEYKEVKGACKKILDDFGKVDVLVCNAGWTIRAPINKMKIEVWEKAVAVNLSGAFYFIHSLINSMLEQKKGSIVIIGSSATLNGGGGGVHYAASKAGLIGLVKGLSYELLPKGIRANLITPALIDTPMLRERYPDTKEVNKLLADQLPVGRIGRPEDIANIALFLASDMSKYIVGQEIIADGGRILYKHPAGS